MLSWKELVHLSEKELAAQDVAEVNLACAADLPGSEKLDAAFCLERLDYCAERVRQYTEPRMKLSHDKPQEYNNSEAYFRILVLITVLQRDLGVRYNPAKIPKDVPLVPEDSFIYGIFQGQGGTCASMPVVYVAVGRRLGYPLKLVGAKRHCFARWDEPGGERFNIEAAGKGLSCPPDDYYRVGMYEVTAEYEQKCCLLQSEKPREELAGFLKTRGGFWAEYKNYRRAAEAYAWAYALASHNVGLHTCLGMTLDEWHETLQKMEPPGFPPVHPVWGPRRFPPPVPEKMEQNLLYLEALENVLKDKEHDQRWWEPMRRGMTPWRRPLRMDVSFRPTGCDISFRLASDCVPMGTM